MTDTRIWTFTAAELCRLAVDALTALGTPRDIAGEVADSLVLSNLVGHDSHGVTRLLQYSGWIRDGQIRQAARPSAERRRTATAVVDGGWGFGQLAAHLATKLAIEIARDHGTAAVTIRNGNHIGRLGEYVATMAEAGVVGIAFANSGAVVAPFGGTGRALGTNPFAWAAPGGPTGPLVVDFSTAGVAEGKLRLAFADGKPVAPGLIVDPGGRPSTDPADFFAGGALLPFGGHKGSGMSVQIELLGGLLTGMGPACTPTYAGGNGTVLLAMDVAPFIDLATFQVDAAEFRAGLVALGQGPTAGTVLLPGDVEARTKREREHSGIPVSAAILAQIYELTDELGVTRARATAQHADA